MAGSPTIAAGPGVRDKLEPETTASYVRLIRETRSARGKPTPFEADVEQPLGPGAFFDKLAGRCDELRVGFLR